jgi:hypothetical protein
VVRAPLNRFATRQELRELRNLLVEKAVVHHSGAVVRQELRRGAVRNELESAANRGVLIDRLALGRPSRGHALVADDSLREIAISKHGLGEQRAIEGHDVVPVPGKVLRPAEAPAMANSCQK